MVLPYSINTKHMGRQYLIHLSIINLIFFSNNLKRRWTLVNEKPILQHIYPNASEKLLLRFLSHRKGVARNKQSSL